MAVKFVERRIPDEMRNYFFQAFDNQTDLGAGKDISLEDFESPQKQQFDVPHSIVKAPRTVATDAVLKPLGHIELDCPPDVYAVVGVRFGAGNRVDSRDFQLLVVPDESVELVAYASSCGVDDRRVRLELDLDDAPNESVPMAMPIDSGEFVDPPQSAAGVAAGRVIGLHAFDHRARPLVQSLRMEFSVEASPVLECRELEPSSIWRRVLPRIVSYQFVQQSVQEGSYVVEPLTEQDRELGWEWRGWFEVQRNVVSVFYSPLLNRIALDLFGGDLPHGFALRAGSFQPRVEHIEVVIGHRSRLIQPDPSDPSMKRKTKVTGVRKTSFI